MRACPSANFPGQNALRAGHSINITLPANPGPVQALNVRVNVLQAVILSGIIGNLMTVIIEIHCGLTLNSVVTRVMICPVVIIPAPDAWGNESRSAVIDRNFIQPIISGFFIYIN